MGDCSINDGKYPEDAGCMQQYKREEKNTMKEAILNEITDYPGDRITALQLANYAGISVSHETAPRVRSFIRELIADGNPIGSDNRGYFIITERAELEDTLESLQSRCDAIQNRINNITAAYSAVRANRYKDTTLDIKDRCRYYVVHIAETTNIPYQAVWTMAYRKLQKITGVDLVNLPEWYKGSVLNFVVNRGLADELYTVLYVLEGALV
jgi:hypothetical protein